jgi:peptidoglycan L-alanyl-D-glutamate endopeptidase CwlK
MTDGDRNILSYVHPIVAQKGEMVLDKCASSGIQMGVCSGLRDFKIQHDLFIKGRILKNGIWVPVDPINHKGIVTNSDAGDSFHNYGLAIDCVLDSNPFKPGLQPTWDDFRDSNKDSVNDWDTYGEIAMELGFSWGRYFPGLKDIPHIQYTAGLTLKQIKFIYNASGMSGVWETITQLHNEHEI